jgi:hypothetical protein
MSTDRTQNLSAQLTQIIEKTTLLVDFCNRQQQEIEHLTQERNHLANILKDQKYQNAQLEQQFKTLEIAHSLNNSGNDKKKLDMKKKISELVSEIDKCILLLKK